MLKDSVFQDHLISFKKEGSSCEMLSHFVLRYSAIQLG